MESKLNRKKILLFKIDKIKENEDLIFNPLLLYIT